MIDSETAMLLKQEFSLKENHFVILEYLSDHKSATAEEIYKKTRVPRGRAYEFLTDLVDSGFIEAEYKRPKLYKLKDPKQAFADALAIKERRFIENERRAMRIALKLERQRAQKKENTLFEYITDDDEAYRTTTNMFLNSKTFRATARTPNMIISQEANTFPRRRYREQLLDKIGAGEIEVKYMFAGDLVKKRIIETKDRAALKNIRDLLKFKNVDLRWITLAEMNAKFVSGLITDDEVKLGFYHHDVPVSNMIHVRSREFAQIMAHIYDSVFSDAKKVDERFIKDIEKHLR